MKSTLTTKSPPSLASFVISLNGRAPWRFTAPYIPGTFLATLAKQPRFLAPYVTVAILPVGAPAENYVRQGGAWVTVAIPS
jgi:hypothetical protein